MKRKLSNKFRDQVQGFLLFFYYLKVQALA